MSTKTTVTELIHEITQHGYDVMFSADFDGMVTVTYSQPTRTHRDYIRHEHLSYPGGSMEELNKKVIQSLGHFLEEAKAGKPQKDGLAKD